MPTLDPDGRAALARLYDLDLSVDPGDVDLYLALAARTGGPIVELCAGSGRVAIPLAEAGHEVTVVDVDGAMLARAVTRLASGGRDVEARLHVVEGDLFTVPVPGRGTYRLAVLALNSILLLGDLRRRRQAIDVLAALLVDGGVAVVDAWLPQSEDLARFDGRLGLEWVRRDPETGATVLKQASAWYDGTTGTIALTTIFDEGLPGVPTTALDPGGFTPSRDRGRAALPRGGRRARGGDPRRGL